MKKLDSGVGKGQKCCVGNASKELVVDEVGWEKRIRRGKYKTPSQMSNDGTLTVSFAWNVGKCVRFVFGF